MCAKMVDRPWPRFSPPHIMWAMTATIMAAHTKNSLQTHNCKRHFTARAISFLSYALPNSVKGISCLSELCLMHYVCLSFC